MRHIPPRWRAWSLAARAPAPFLACLPPNEGSSHLCLHAKSMSSHSVQQAEIHPPQTRGVSSIFHPRISWGWTFLARLEPPLFCPFPAAIAMPQMRALAATSQSNCNLLVIKRRFHCVMMPQRSCCHPPPSRHLHLCHQCAHLSPRQPALSDPRF